MKPELRTLIDRFREAQDQGVQTLVRVLRLPLPSSGRDWALYCEENEIHSLRELRGVGIHAHGFGVELKIGDLTIDFDWGFNGEPDGFDGWRLYNFTLDNETGVKCTHEEVNAWLEEAERDGELIQGRYLYFDSTRRSSLRECESDG